MVTPPPPHIMASYMRTLAALLTLASVALLLAACTTAYGQSPSRPTFASASTSELTYVAGSTVSLAFPTATGGTGALTYTFAPITSFRLFAGATIPGLTFNGSASPPTLTGTPSAPTGHSQTYAFEYRATDTASRTATRTYIITIEADSAPSFAETTYSKTFYVDRWEAWTPPAVTGGNDRGPTQYSLAAPSGEDAAYWTGGPGGTAPGFATSTANDQLQIIAQPSATRAAQDATLTYTDADGDSVSATVRVTIANASEPDFSRDSVKAHWILNGKPRNATQTSDQVTAGTIPGVKLGAVPPGPPVQ